MSESTELFLVAISMILFGKSIRSLLQQSHRVKLTPRLADAVIKGLIPLEEAAEEVKPTGPAI